MFSDYSSGMSSGNRRDGYIRNVVVGSGETRPGQRLGSFCSADYVFGGYGILGND